MFLSIGIDQKIMEDALNGDAVSQKIYRQAVKVAEAKAALSDAKRLLTLCQEEETRLVREYMRANGNGVILPPKYMDRDDAKEHHPMCGDANCGHPGH
jgi:hypothetical protein